MKDNKVAIIGLSFEFPNVNKVEDLWDGLVTGKCFYHNAFQQGSEYVDAWGSVENLKGFDHNFFGYSYHEACRIDPQHRHLLQHSWWAMENAGYMNKPQLPVTAIFTSASENHYLWHNLDGEVQMGMENEALLGNMPDSPATRIAWKLGATGQASTVQSGFSSGLAALHQARVALLTGQAEMALVGAVSFAAPHQKGYDYLPGGIRSADGKIRVFDRDASGTVFTNGVAVLVLKPLDRALEQSDNILGVLESSALNNDGGDNAGFTAPSVSGQRQVIQRAMRLASVSADEIALYEAHGTGTRLGDPIEFTALREAWPDTLSEEPTCALQSVKANLGHLDTVSGLAGVIKACLVLKHRQLPPQIHYQHPNPHIQLEESPFFINTMVQPLTDNARFACVSALGIGGTNAHVILSTPSQNTAPSFPAPQGLFLFSAPTKKALSQLQHSWMTWQADDSVVAKSAAVTRQGRTAFRVRRSMWVNSAKELTNKVESLSQTASIVEGTPVVALMFTGQGAQYTGMGQYLYQQSAFFRDRLDEKLAVLQQLSGDDYYRILFEQQDAIHQPQYTQPGMLALEVALAEYLQYCGIQADLMIGYSLGEYAAMVASQALSFHDAAGLVLQRAQLIEKTQPGMMCSVMIDKDSLPPLLEGIELDIAAQNSSTMTVLAGSADNIKRFMARSEENSVFCQPLKLKRAFHSRFLDPILPAYHHVLQNVTFVSEQVPVISSLTGKLTNIHQFGQPEYWLRQMREPVVFSDAVNCATEFAKNLCFIEVGPGHTLKTLASQSTDQLCVNLLPHPAEMDKAEQTLFTSLGLLWQQGVDIQWQNVLDPDKATAYPSLPQYPFEQTEC